MLHLEKWLCTKPTFNTFQSVKKKLKNTYFQTPIFTSCLKKRVKIFDERQLFPKILIIERDFLKSFYERQLKKKW